MIVLIYFVLPKNIFDKVIVLEILKGRHFLLGGRRTNIDFCLFTYIYIDMHFIKFENWLLCSKQDKSYYNVNVKSSLKLNGL